MPITRPHNAWKDLVWDMIWVVAEIERDIEITEGDEPYPKLFKLRPPEEDARQALAMQIRAELQAARTS